MFTINLCMICIEGYNGANDLDIFVPHFFNALYLTKNRLIAEEKIFVMTTLRGLSTQLVKKYRKFV